MKNLFLAGLTSASLIALLAQTGYAHGGQYRGPGDVVPPSPGGGRGTGPSGPSTGGPGGPATPGPGGPATPGPSGPTTGGPAGPSGGRAPTTGGHGIQLDEDLDKWVYWWEFNKDPFIRLKDAIGGGGPASSGDEFFLGAARKAEAKDTMRPTDEEKQTSILPALKKAIDSTEQRDINSSCMVAMAKIGKDDLPDGKHLEDVFLPRLKKNDQEVAETAALSFGIAAIDNIKYLETLISLAKDDANGRALCGKAEVQDRTRAFAAYGIGLMAYGNGKIDFKEKAFTALESLVADKKVSSRNIKVAAINGIGLLNIPTTEPSGQKLLSSALDCLQKYYMENLGAGEQLLQAHVPPAIAKLLGKNGDPKDVEKFKKIFAADLAEKGAVKRTGINIFQSCALALGQLCQNADDEKSPDAEYVKQLLDAWHNHKDAQTRYFSGLAIGQIGGKTGSKWVDMVLRKEFEHAGKALEKPWIAMAMGVYAFEKYEAQKAEKNSIDVQEDFGKVLHEALSEVKDPGAQSAFAVALGLINYKDAADDMRALLGKVRSQDELAGYLCIGLALMNDQRSIADIQNIVQGATRRPDLLKQSAIALGKLGDKSAADMLQKLLAEGDTNLAKLSAIASALGFIGDRRSIEPLKQMLFNEQLTELSRAFAAVALGGVADKENLPWNSKIAQNTNYRAAVETLTDKSAGILDIL
jgi:HEAT repeat protein